MNFSRFFRVFFEKKSQNPSPSPSPEKNAKKTHFPVAIHAEIWYNSGIDIIKEN